MDETMNTTLKENQFDEDIFTMLLNILEEEKYFDEAIMADLKMLFKRKYISQDDIENVFCKKDTNELSLFYS